MGASLQGIGSMEGCLFFLELPGPLGFWGVGGSTQTLDPDLVRTGKD